MALFNEDTTTLKIREWCGNVDLVFQLRAEQHGEKLGGESVSDSSWLVSRLLSGGGGLLLATSAKKTNMKIQLIACTWHFK